MKTVRPIAFYLPQYHPVPENDTWWGKGFTEWTNVTRARPLFPSHYQPHLPADLGFYDLRLPEARQAQADLAREYGIYGFCYYHYWFNGTRLLGRPLDEVRASAQPDFPFCLCWANENWTRAWDGRATELLIGQDYGPVDDRAHGRWLAGVFEDRRYIRVNGRPLFLVYQPSLLPDPAATAAIWREEAQRAGVSELYLCAVESFRNRERAAPASLGFDAAVEFQPDTLALLTLTEKAYWRIVQKVGLLSGALVIPYATWVRRALAQPPRPYTRFPCVTPGWDNSPRRRRGAFMLHHSRPHLYEDWLARTIAAFRPPSADENLIFINAWNEWAEGNHLEPCQRWGRAYLEATRRALSLAYLGPTGLSSPARVDPDD